MKFKKHLILLLLAGMFSLTSCSNDDDGDTEDNTVLGTWTLVEMNPDAVGLDDCPNKPVITFKADGDADWTLYDPDNNCQASTDTGTWEKNSGTQYTMNIPGFDPFVGTVEFSSSTRFTFTTTYSGFTAVLTFAK